MSIHCRSSTAMTRAGAPADVEAQPTQDVEGPALVSIGVRDAGRAADIDEPEQVQEVWAVLVGIHPHLPQAEAHLLGDGSGVSASLIPQLLRNRSSTR